MKRLLVLRHGNTFLPGEPPRRIGACTDLPLTPHGRAQAQDVATLLRAEGRCPEFVVAGPLRRAGETAGIILAALPRARALPVAGWLNEIDHGPDEGLTEQAVIERVGVDALARWDRRGEPAPGWPVDRAARIADGRRAIAALPAAATTLLVTSNGAARFILLALGLADATRSLKLRTGALGEIEVGDDAARLCRWDLRPGEAELNWRTGAQS